MISLDGLLTLYNDKERSVVVRIEGKSHIKKQNRQYGRREKTLSKELRKLNNEFSHYFVVGLNRNITRTKLYPTVLI